MLIYKILEQFYLFHIKLRLIGIFTFFHFTGQVNLEFVEFAKLIYDNRV